MKKLSLLFATIVAMVLIGCGSGGGGSSSEEVVPTIENSFPSFGYTPNSSYMKLSYVSVPYNAANQFLQNIISKGNNFQPTGLNGYEGNITYGGVDYLAIAHKEEIPRYNYTVSINLYADNLVIATNTAKEIHGEISGELTITILGMSFQGINRPSGINPDIFHTYANKLESPEWGFKCTRHSAIECEKNSTDDKYKFTWLSNVPGADVSFVIDNLNPFE
jgi:hypothetical protein